MSELNFRRAGPSDAAAVARLTRDAYARWVPVLGREPLPMSADYDLAVREHLIDLVEVDGALLALVEMALEPEHLLIVNLAIAPAEQGRGLGRHLLLHAEAMARRSGRPRLRLYTNGLMLANIRLYERNGYAIDRTETRGPNWSVIHMSKPTPIA